MITKMTGVVSCGLYIENLLLKKSFYKDETVIQCNEASVQEGWNVGAMSAKSMG